MMPRFLAEDYLVDAICRKQTRLAQLLLVCPDLTRRDAKHILTSKFMTYRRPWEKDQKLKCSIDFNGDLQEDLGSLAKQNVVERSFLLFNGSKYFIGHGEHDIVIPNSDPGSDCEVFEPISKANQHYKHEKKECGDDFLPLKYFDTSLLLELPSLTSEVKNHRQDTSGMCVGLEFAQMEDPMEEVTSVVTTFHANERLLVFSGLLNGSNNNASKIMLESYKCLSGDYWVADDQITPRLTTNIYDNLFLNGLAEEKVFCEDSNSNVPYLQDLAAITSQHSGDASVSGIETNLLHKFAENEQQDGLNQVSPFLNDDLITPDLKPVQSTLTFALSSLQVMEETIPTMTCFESEIKVAESLLKLDRIPDVIENFSTMKLFLPEPSLKPLHLAQCSWNGVLNNLSEALHVQRDTDLTELEMSLQWDAVLHAASDMSILRKKLQKEGLISYRKTKESPKDDFVPILLEQSLDCSISITGISELEVISSCLDVPSVRNPYPEQNAIEQKVQAATLSQNRQIDNVNIKQKVKAKPMANEEPKNSFDGFMQLIGKRNKYSMNDITSTNTKALSAMPKLKTAGNLQLKRLRLAAANQNVMSDLVKKKDKLESLKSDHIEIVQPQADLYKLVEVCIKGKILELVLMVERETMPFLNFLNQRKLVSANCQLPKATREYSRFLLQQQKKIFDDEKRRGRALDQTNLMLIEIFHDIVSVYYLLVHVSGISALAYLNHAMQNVMSSEAFKMLPSSRDHGVMFNELLKNLSVFGGNKNQQQDFAHPKFEQLKMILTQFYRKNMKKINQLKMVVLCSTKCRYLFFHLCQDLNQHFKSISYDLHAVALNIESTINAVGILNIIRRKQSDILVICDHMMCENFPWDKFHLLVEYEHSEESPWRPHCFQHGITHKSLLGVLPHSDQLLETPSKSSKAKRQEILKNQYVLIGSKNVTELGNVLHLLETRFNILITEKTYKFENESVRYPDLILSETSCVLLENISLVNTEGASEKFKRLMIQLGSIKQKFTTCCILLISLSKSTEKANRYDLSGSGPINLGKLNATLNQYTSALEDFEVHALCCFSAHDVAEFIFQLTCIAYNSSMLKSDGDVADRSWISSQEGKEESFLQHIPCINAFVAQRMLTCNSLPHICRMQKDEFMSYHGWIPTRIREEIYSCLHELVSKQDIEHTVENIQEIQSSRSFPDQTVLSDNTHTYNTSYVKADYQGQRRGQYQGNVDDLVMAAKMQLEKFVERNPQRALKNHLQHMDQSRPQLSCDNWYRQTGQDLISESSFGRKIYPLAMTNRKIYPIAQHFQSNEIVHDQGQSGTSGSVNIGVAQPMQRGPGTEVRKASFSNFSTYQNTFNHDHATTITPGTRTKMLKYRKVPGSKDGQTRLTFY